MGPREQCLILGAGLAGAQAAAALRSSAFEGAVTIVGDEVHAPYLRPPLSKDYLQGRATADSLLVHPTAWYRDNRIELLLGRSATSLDPERRRVTLSDGEELPYDALLLATGSRARRLTVPGADLDGVLYLRRVDDSDRLRAAFATAPAVAIIGGGWIGLETAASARLAGCNVTILETGALPLLRVVGPEVASSIAELHTSHGVHLRSGVSVDSIVGSNGRATGVRLADGEVIEADVVIVGIGVHPNIEIAEGTSLRTDNGIIVDEHLRTNDPRVFAAGDIANAYNPAIGAYIRVEHWATAKNQGTVAGANMNGGLQPYDRLPFFYSDQYDLGLEYTGYAPPGSYDAVVFRGEVAAREFVAFWLSGGKVLAGMNVNVWDVSDDIAAIINARRVIDVSKLTDPDVPLSVLASG